MYDEAIATRICEEISAGRSLRSICTDDGVPDKATVFRWLAANEEFRDQYARAREAQADAMLEDILEIADDGINDTFEDEAGIVKTNHDVIARSRLRVDTRKWAMSKLAPKKYGDKITQEHTGPNGAALMPTLIYETPAGAPAAAELAGEDAEAEGGAAK